MLINQQNVQPSAVDQSQENILEKSFSVAKANETKKQETNDLVNKVTLRLKNPKMQERYQEYQQATAKDKTLKLILFFIILISGLLITLFILKHLIEKSSSNSDPTKDDSRLQDYEVLKF